MDWKTVKYETIGAIARISLNRPETHNTMSAQLIKDLDAAVRHADADPDVRVIIIRGEGASFSAGHDLSASPNEALQEDFRRRHAEGIESRLDAEEEYYYEPNLTIRNVRKPTIAALKGHVVLGALMTALMCDLVVAEESTNIWNPSLRHTGTGGEVMVLPWEIGVRKTKEMLWTGDPLDVREAERLGMINRVVKDGTLDAECLRLAERIALMPPRAVALTKRSLNKVQEIQGMLTAFEHHFLVHQLGHATREASEWSAEARRRAREGGFRGWLEYRDGPFREQARKDYVKADLLAALRASGDELVRTVRSLPAATLEEGRYEHGWTARQILAHVAAIEWTYPRLLAAASEAPKPEAAGSASVDIDAYNARQVAKRAGASVEELIAEFQKNRETTIRAVEGADGSLLAQPVRSAGGREGTLAEVLMQVAIDHVRGHLRDIVGPGAGTR